MTCGEFSERISDYIEGESSAEVRTAMDGHAADCPGCSQKLMETRALTDQLARLPRIRPSLGFDFALRSRLLMEVSESKRWPHRVRNFLFPSFPRALLSGALAAMLAVGFTTLLQETPVWQHPGAEVAQQNAAPLGTPSTNEQYRGALRQLSQEESYTISSKLYNSREDTVKPLPRELIRAAKYAPGVRPTVVRF